MTTWRRHAAVLALAAILLRAVVPVGWMQNAHAFSAGVPIVICTLTGDKLIVPPANGPSHDQQHDAADKAPCSFAAIANLAPPTTAAAFVPTLTQTHIDEAPAAIAAPRMAPNSGWQSRAPPRAV